MKKIKLLLALGLGLSVTTFAQQKTKVQLGLKTGVSLSTFEISGPGREAYLASSIVGEKEIKVKPHYFFGMIADISLSSQWMLQPGLVYINKGNRLQETIDYTEYINTTRHAHRGHFREEVRLSYLEVPLNVVFNLPLKNGSIFLGSGPYAGMALVGKERIAVDYVNTISAVGMADVKSNETEFNAKRDIEWENDGYKRMDFGVNFLAGYRFKRGANFNVGYGLGLATVGELKSEQVTMKNRVITIGVGCRL